MLHRAQLDFSMEQTTHTYTNNLILKIFGCADLGSFEEHKDVCNKLNLMDVCNKIRVYDLEELNESFNKTYWFT